MKPIIHGLETINGQKVKVPTKEVNIQALINTLYANEHKALSKEFLENFDTISNLYKVLFSEGEIPDEILEKTDLELLEMAFEVMDTDPEYFIEKPRGTTDMDFYYEFCRSYGVASAASKLEEYVDEECDFL